MKPTLLILAAGMASRYGSMKQIERFGTDGETIMDYSIYSAIKAGFGKVIFIIKEEFAAVFKADFESKLNGKIDVEFVYQDLEYLVNKKFISKGRTKPWGTGHALLCAKDVIKEPFAVINADDFYGKDAFQKECDFLKNKCSENSYALAGYSLANTLSDHGTVSRGVCMVDAENNLTNIVERTKIYRMNGDIVYEENEVVTKLDENKNVSMNFWCFHPSVFKHAEKLFLKFPEQNIDNIQSEFYITTIADDFLKNNRGTIKVISTTSEWFGVTYKEDAAIVRNSLKKLVALGEYPEKLWRQS